MDSWRAGVSGLCYRTLQQPCAVSAACLLPGTQDATQEVVLLRDTLLTHCAVSDDGLEQRVSWRAPASMLQLVALPNRHLLIIAEGGRCSLHAWQEEARGAPAGGPALPPPPLATAMLQAPLDSARNQLQPFGCVVSSNVLSAQLGSGAVASLAAVACMPGVLHLVRAAPCGQSSSSSAAAAGDQQQQRQPAMELQSKGFLLHPALLSCHRADGSRQAPPPMASVRVYSRVLAMVWLSPAEQQLERSGRSLLAVLHEYTDGPQPTAVHLDCVAVDWADGSISPGPWSLWNVHPTTRLLQPFPGSGALPPGVLAISSRGVLQVTCLGSGLADTEEAHTAATQQAGSSKAAVAAAGALTTTSSSSSDLCIRSHQLVQWSLGRQPLSCAAVTDSCWLVGDSGAGLTLLRLPGAGSTTAVWQALQTSCPLAIPDVLLCVPVVPPAATSSQGSQQDMAIDTQQELQQQQAGAAGDIHALVVVGSRCSSSQVVGLTAAFAAAAGLHGACAAPPGLPAPVCPVLQPAFLPSLAGAQAVAAYRDPSGSLPEQQLLVACGAAPRGKLAAVRSGAGLVPLTLDGPELPSDALLFPISQHQRCRHAQQQQPEQQRQYHHSMLGFSFPSAGLTSVMSLAGDTFKQLQLPGLAADAASLLLTGMAGGWLVQVASAGVRVLDGSTDWQLAASWSPPHGETLFGEGGKGEQWGHTISLAACAAACGSELVVACGAHMSLLHVSCCDGKVSLVATCELHQQASALGLLRLSGGQLLVAAGLWVDNSLLLLAWPAVPSVAAAAPAAAAAAAATAAQELLVAARVDLAAEQARSVALLPLDSSAHVLLVGTNSGSVLMWELAGSSSGGGNGQQQQQWTLQHGRSVQISNTSVSLQQVWLPPDEQPSSSTTTTTSSSSSGSSYVSCVYAMAGAGALLRPNSALTHLRQLQQQSQGRAEAALGIAATQCVQVSRLCGSETCLSAAAVHTASMPCSMAWVSTSHRLCFGSVSVQHQLRWRSRPLPGTPLAMAVHEASNTLLLLLAADPYASSSSVEQQQQLVVLDAKSLDVVMCVGLTPGHTFAFLEVLELPATSQQQQQQPAAASVPVAAAGASSSSQSAADEQQQQPGCLPFVVLGSAVAVECASSADAGASSSGSRAGAAAPASQTLGMLSIFELRHSLVQQQDCQPGGDSCAAAPELRYELVLHGMLPLTVTPASACTVLPALLASKQQQAPDSQQPSSGGRAGSTASADADTAAGAAAALVTGVSQTPLLAVGSADEVSLLRVLVDDAASREQQALQQALGRVAQVGKLDVGELTAGPGTDSSSLQHNTAAPAPAAPASSVHLPAWHAAMSSRAGTHHWYGRVAACEQGYSPVVDGGGVARLRSTGSILYAMESHGLVTTLQALAAAPDSWVALLPVGRQGPDDWRGALMAVDMLPATQDGGEVAGPHTGSHRALLVATHPAGLLLLQRYLAVERNNLAAELREAEAAWEAGARPEYGGGGGGGHAHLRLLQRPPVPVVVQPWQGAGEVAPWQQQQQQQEGQQQQEQQARQQRPGRPAGRAGLAAAAAAAAAAGGASGISAAEVQGVLGLLDPLPSDAQPMMPSVVAAPAPSTTLLCAARLGLHPQPLDGDDGDGSRTPPDDASASAARAAAAQTVLCLSASGGVSGAALLPPYEAMALLNEQSRLVWQLEGAPEQPLLQVEKAAPSNSTVLRLLYRAGGLAARAQGHALAPGAVTPRAAAARWHDAPKPANEEDALDEEGSALEGCVDADLLLSRATGSTLTADADVLHAQVMHQLLWQAVL